MNKSETVFIIKGAKKCGKSEAIDTLSMLSFGRVLSVRPLSKGDPLDCLVDWSVCDCLVVDDLGKWGKNGLREALSRLFDQASCLEKKIAIVVRDDVDLDLLPEAMKDAEIIEIRSPEDVPQQLL